MTDETGTELQLKLATEIVVAYLGQNAAEPKDIPVLIHDARRALALPLTQLVSPEAIEAVAAPTLRRTESADRDIQAHSRPDFDRASHNDRAAPAAAPAVPVGDSVTEEFIFSLEDGKPYRSLRRHLMAKYGMTPDDYRRKWNLPLDYPMVAPSYAKDRAQIAKRIGLGRTPAAPRKQPRRSR